MQKELERLPETLQEYVISANLGLHRYTSEYSKAFRIIMDTVSSSLIFRGVLYVISGLLQDEKALEPLRDSIALLTVKELDVAKFRRLALLSIVERLIEEELRELTRARYRIERYFDKDWGYVYVITVDLNAKQALELNLKLQERFPGIPIVVEWTGDMDVSDRELIDYLVEILARGGFKAKAPPGFDAVELVREIRED
jgi:hypothetical protein